MSPHQLFLLADQLRTQARSLERESVTTLALTMKLTLSCSTQTIMSETDMFGSLDIAYQKVPPSAIYLTQNLALVRKFETRPTSEYRLRFDASSIMVSPDGNLVVSDRQLDRVSVYNIMGKSILEMNMSLMGQPISGAQLNSGDIVIVREKSSMCVFGPNGKDKRVIKENMSKPCCIAVNSDGNFLVLDYDMKTIMTFCGKTYAKIGQVRVPYKMGSKWDKLVVNQDGNFVSKKRARETGVRWRSYWGSSQNGQSREIWSRSRAGGTRHVWEAK